MRTVDITYKETEIKEMLSSFFNSKLPHREIVIDALFEELSATDAGLKNVLLATKGVAITLESYNLSLHEKVAVPTRRLSDWRFDIEKMKDAQLILNDTLEAEIVDFKRTYEAPLKVKYKFIRESGEVEENTEWITPEHIIKSL